MNYRLEQRTIGFGIDPVTRLATQGIEGTFFVPSYQRGYRWTADEVTKLLDDIYESGGQPYSLQPIVLQTRNTGAWELIDGQQRLTTLWLLLRFMNKGEPRYRLEYQTRPGCQTYLQQIDTELATQNIDYFHIHQAHITIATWFVNKMGAKYQQFLVDEMFRLLSTSVHVIWYEVPATEEPIPLFTRLNQGRIPLTDAELIKAVLLTQIEKDKPGREVEVAAQWDGIERDLQRDEIWAFIAHQDAQQHSTRIDLLLDTLAKKPTEARRYYTFDTLQEEAQKNSLAFWDKVVTLHAQILGWFEEPRWYNKIGFLVACGISIGEVLELAQGQRKMAFNDALTARIKTIIRTAVDDLGDLSYENHSHNLILQRLLLLFNVETCRERFPFEKHAGTDWTLEHIHAQNAQDLNRADQWDAWINEHRKALVTIRTERNISTVNNLLAEVDEATVQLHTPQFGREQFKELAGKVLLALNDGILEEADHSIANLALLSRSDNAALSNAVFAVKRHKVLERDRRGDYIPAATRNVFLKYYTPVDQLQLHFWGEADKSAYLHTIQLTLSDYLQ